jgi:hypothetical protein
VSREQELEILKGQSEALKDELKELENEIGKISAEKKEQGVRYANSNFSYWSYTGC